MIICQETQEQFQQEHKKRNKKNKNKNNKNKNNKNNKNKNKIYYCGSMQGGMCKMDLCRGARCYISSNFSPLHQ